MYLSAHGTTYRIDDERLLIQVLDATPDTIAGVLATLPQGAMRVTMAGHTVVVRTEVDVRRLAARRSAR